MNNIMLKRITALILTLTMLIGMVPLADADTLDPFGGGGNLSPAPTPIFWSDEYPTDQILIAKNGTYTFYVYTQNYPSSVQISNSSAISLDGEPQTVTSVNKLDHSWGQFSLYQITVKGVGYGESSLSVYANVSNKNKSNAGNIQLSFSVTDPKELILHKNNGDSDDPTVTLNGLSIELPTYEQYGTDFGTKPSGMYFAGWSTAKASGTDVKQPGDVVTLSSDTDYYAYWMPSYYVKYTADDNDPYVPDNPIEDTKIIGLPTLEEIGMSANGRTFAGWSVSESPSVSNAVAAGGTLDLATSGRTGGDTAADNRLSIVAVWGTTREVDFKANGGLGAERSVSGIQGMKITLPGDGYFFREGYKQVGWSTNSDAEDLDVNDSLPTSGFYALNAEYAVPTGTDPVALYAVWQNSPIDELLVPEKHYYIHEGETMTLYVYTNNANDQVEVGNTTVASFTPGDPDQNDKGVSDVIKYPLIVTANSVGDTILKLKWGSLDKKTTGNYICYIHVVPEDTLSLYYNLNGGKGNIDRQTNADSSVVKYQSGDGLTNGDLYFYGWGDSPNVKYTETALYHKPGDKYTFGTSDHMVYAVWGESNILTYNLNGGSGTAPSRIIATSLQPYKKIPVAHGTNMTAPNGKYFYGWSTDKASDPITATSLLQPDDSLSLDKDITLYAIWGSKSKVSFDMNGATSITAPADQYVSQNSNSPDKLRMPFDASWTYNSKMLIGWSTSSTNNIILNDDGTFKAGTGGDLTTFYPAGTELKKAFASDTTLYAVWGGSDQYKVSFNGNGGPCGIGVMYSKPDSQNPDKQYITLPNNTALKYYTDDGKVFEFRGWCDENDADTITEDGQDSLPQVYKPNDLYEVTQDQKLYAIWRQIEGPTNVKIEISVRLENAVPSEPAEYGGDKYTFAQDINNANALEYISAWETVAGVNEVAEHLTQKFWDYVNSQIGKPARNGTAFPNIGNHVYDPEKETLIFYVIKYQTNPANGSTPSFHIDGVIRSKDECGLVYVANGGTGHTPQGVLGQKHDESDPTIVTVEPNQGFELDGKSIDKNGKPFELYREGYEFAGWNTEADGSGTTYMPGDGIKLVNDNFRDPDEKIVYLYAQWISKLFSVTGHKIWMDNNNAAAKRPSSITIKLTGYGKNNAVKFEETKTITGPSWSWAFINLPKMDEDQEIRYELTEDEVSDYTTEVITTKNEKNSEIVSITANVNNTLEAGKATVPFVKIWDDASNQDGVRPTSLVITLYQTIGNETSIVSDNKITNPVTLNASDFTGDTWRYTWKDLPKYISDESDEKIIYTVRETLTGSDYTPNVTQANASNTYTITNTHKTLTTTYTANKVWDDANNQDGVRPASVKITLNTETYVYDTVELSEGNQWTKTWTDLPVKAACEEIKYSVAEDTTTLEELGYTADYSLNGNTFTVKNSRATETTTYTVNKVWDDANNQDGVRPASVKVTLNTDTGVYESVELSEGNNWTKSWNDLPKYSGGYEITYTVNEPTVPNGYTKTVDGNTIKNTHHIAKTKVIVKKVWDDASNQDGERTNVVVTLIADGVTTNLTDTLTTADNASITFDNLDVYKAGIPISYTVVEDALEGYSASYGDVTGDALNGYEIIVTNTHAAATTTFSVTKFWDDNDDRDGERTKLTLAVVKKTATGTTEVVDSHTLTAEELSNTPFSYTFYNLPVNEAGKSIVYEGAEFDIPEGYTPGEWVKISNYEYKITNTHEPLTTDVTVTKIWDDDNNRDGKRQEVNVKLYADGKFTGFEEKLSTVNSNEVTFTGLLAYRDHGTPIQYSVVEETLNGYSTDYSNVTGDPDNGYAVTITNKHGIEKTEITVTKVWEDNDDQDGLRGDYEVSLFADGEEVSGTAVELSATELSHTWTELPVYNKGSVITYTVQEKTVPEEYSALVNGFTITNKHEPAKTSITVTKHWEDNDDLDKARKEVKITLLGDEKTIRTETFTTDQDNTVTFADLDVYRDHGVEISYTLAEEIIPGYTGEIGNLISNGNGGYTVTVTNKRGDVELTKEAAIEGGNAKAAAGDKILFTITVENTGALDLTDMKITDKRFTDENADVKIDGKAADSELNGDTVNLDVVATGAEPIIITYYYTVTEADTLAGKVDNTANVTATADPKDSNVYDEGSTTTPTVEAKGHLTYTKTEVSKPANGKAYAAGEQVTWTLKVENDGNLTIENVTVVDEKTKDNLSAGTLKPGEHKEFTSKPYTVTEQDVLNGEVYNVVTGKGDSPDPKEPNVPVTPGDDTVETVPAEPKLTVTKTSDKEGKRVAKGERITYKIVVKNEGNITLHNVEVNDELTGMKQKLDTLNIGASREFITRWIVTDKDVKAGSVLNSVTAEADPVPNPKDPDHPFTPSDEDDVTDKTKDPGISIEKTIPDKKAFYKKDEKIEYQIKITNTGDIELTNVILKDSLYKNVEDIKVNGTPTNLDGVMIRVGDLEAGETAIVTYMYPVTNNGNRTVENTAKVTAKDPDGVEVGDEDREDARIAKEDPVIHELIVHYWYEEIGGEVAAPDSIHYYYTGDNYNIKSPDIPGYDCDKPKLKGTMPDKDVEFNVIYTPIKHHLTIKYVDINGNELFKKYTDLLRTGDEYFVPSPVINGYTTQDILVTGIMPTHDKTITVVYVKPDTLTVIHDFNVPRFGERIILNIGECYE